ncbi:MAG: aldehyde dehydrogenase family protein, partial [Planctomycetota bacterium]|nr:aldehyde dehydrogenase family protein [Planctomycetota bacterium]
MTHGTYQTPDPVNEPVRGYAPGSPERKSLQAELKRMRSNPIEVPLLVGGEKVETGNTAKMRSPHNHGMDLGTYHQARPEDVTRAINAATDARADWQALPWEERATVFLRAADLLAGPWRDRVNASTMLGQSKTCHQAEIDAACELIDFWRFNAYYAQR